MSRTKPRLGPATNRDEQIKALLAKVDKDSTVVRVRTWLAEGGGVYMQPQAASLSSALVLSCCPGHASEEMLGVLSPVLVTPSEKLVILFEAGAKPAPCPSWS